MDNIPEERQQRYTLWKKNTKLLYDYLNTNTSKWPSLTCQFFPDLDTATDTHRVLLSSFTSSQVPDDEDIHIASISTLRHLPWSSLNNFDMDEMEFKPDTYTKLPPKNLQTRLTIRFPHGDCNRATFLPQNPDVISAASSDGSVYIFDRTKHGTTSISTNSRPYEIQLLPKSIGVSEAVGLAWNLQRQATLATCYSDGALRVWDITTFTRNDPVMDTEMALFQDEKSNGFNDVSWMISHDSILAIGREDNILALHDLRSPQQPTLTPGKFHQGGINSCKFNLSQDLLLASAGGDGQVHLWDIRKLQEPIMTLSHGSAISTIAWNQYEPSVIATAGQEDGLVKLWNASDAQLLFTHGGHMLGVNDVAWSSHDKWLLCSVANDNSTHIWRPARTLLD